MTKANELKKYLQAGKVYRRADLAKRSNAVDRHLRQFVKEGVVQKLSGGVYYCPQKTSFGDVPPDDEALVRSFLKDDNFYLTSLNAYNSLGVGTTQLYNEKLVYNYKRDGRHTLDGRNFYFIKRPCFPRKSSQEFLMVDLVNNLHFLAEDKEEVLKNVKDKAQGMRRSLLMGAVKNYGGVRTKAFFKKLYEPNEVLRAA